jgi:hypothetical protein
VRFGRQSFEEMLFGYFLYRELAPRELEAVRPAQAASGAAPGPGS